ncbi:serine/threonine-protein phosphatase 4 regulatory subunit 2-like [Portunus trituberculatus]|uniref:serine/threonine-protein phosphatase 4 regulatory subunit 2-like n=1 Tax=Portunus trituberculatus TaxID=210409 RepID=UPI001E1CF276|nr:serine/threonine-protein phosphatase 4 regulatory subunit 2-like [Portunus trituberculatus]
MGRGIGGKREGRRAARKEEEEEEEQEEEEEDSQLLPKMIIPKIVIQQVTMEEQLIFGALQTLNEEACEDVLEEQEKRGDTPHRAPHWRGRRG